MIEHIAATTQKIVSAIYGGERTHAASPVNANRAEKIATLRTRENVKTIDFGTKAIFAVSASTAHEKPIRASEGLLTKSTATAAKKMAFPAKPSMFVKRKHTVAHAYTVMRLIERPWHGNKGLSGDRGTGLAANVRFKGSEALPFVSWNCIVLMILQAACL
jgi:hypothetical protein